MKSPCMFLREFGQCSDYVAASALSDMLARNCCRHGQTLAHLPLQHVRVAGKPRRRIVEAPLARREAPGAGPPLRRPADEPTLRMSRESVRVRRRFGSRFALACKWKGEFSPGPAEIRSIRVRLGIGFGSSLGPADHRYGLQMMLQHDCQSRGASDPRRLWQRGPSRQDLDKEHPAASSPGRCRGPLGPGTDGGRGWTR